MYVTPKNNSDNEYNNLIYLKILIHLHSYALLFEMLEKLFHDLCNI